jgi:hypothetical protein
MSQPDNETGVVIPHEVMLARLEQSDQMREFFLQMWLQNPALARNTGERIRALLEPINAVPNGDLMPPAPTFHDSAITNR